MTRGKSHTLFFLWAELSVFFICGLSPDQQSSCSPICHGQSSVVEPGKKSSIVRSAVSELVHYTKSGGAGAASKYINFIQSPVCRASHGRRAAFLHSQAPLKWGKKMYYRTSAYDGFLFSLFLKLDFKSEWKMLVIKNF